MNRKLVVLLVAFLTLAPLAAHNPAGAVIRALQLDEVQAEWLHQILRDWRVQNASLSQELRELQGLLRELLQDPENATVIGGTLLRIQALREQIREAKAACRAEFRETLTEEQQQKLARFTRLARWAERSKRVISALKDLGFLL